MFKSKNINQNDPKGFNMKQARFEIMKFAMNNLKGTEKHDAETALAIQLGAKPPKSPYLNYKELQAIKKKEKELKHDFHHQHSNTLQQKIYKPDTKKYNKNSSNKIIKSKRNNVEKTGIYKVNNVPPGIKSKFHPNQKNQKQTKPNFKKCNK